jgi:hypothetical protein
MYMGLYVAIYVQVLSCLGMCLAASGVEPKFFRHILNSGTNSLLLGFVCAL